jgi:3',5'-cyclic AMP phosphodiesterase CpdA
MLRVVLAALVCSAPAWADPASYTYIAAGSQHEWIAASAPLPQIEFGRLAARLVEPRAAAAAAVPDDAGPDWGRAALAPAPFGSAKTATVVGDPARERVAALYLRKTFQVGDELDRIRVLELRARYQDGLVARINDVEVARRAIDAGAPPLRLASRTHGPEWESFYVAVRPGMLRAGDNVLALEVRPSAARLVPQIDVELTAREAERIVRGPIVGRVGTDRATITFETDGAAVGEVRWGTAASTYDHRLAGVPAMHHQFVLTDLPADATIHYQVAAGDEAGDDASFHTLAERQPVVRFIVYGDVRTGHEVHAEIVKAALAEAPDFVVTTGDMVLRGTDEADWQRYFGVAGELLAHVAVYPVVGNHDLGAAGDRERHLEEVFALPDRPPDCPPGSAWYSFDVGGVHFVMLDSNRYDDDRQLAWMTADLERAHGARAIFAAAHHGPFARGPHGGESTAADRYVPVLARHHAAVFFSGHDHIYEHGRAGGITYVVSGGGGAPLYHARCGIPGRPECHGRDRTDGMEAFSSAYHYVVVEVFRDDVRLCPKKPDGTPLDACFRVDLSR